jgi:hypothetical protein
MNESIKSDDYINLPSLKKIAIQFLDSFFSFLRYTALVIKKSKLLLLTGLVCGLILGYSYYSTRPTYFKVSMIVQSTELSKKALSEMIGQLDLQVKAGSKQKLATEFKLSEREVGEVLLIDTYNMNDELLDKDTSTRIHVPFKIIAYINDPDLSDKLQSSIVDYLNNKPFLKKIKENQRKIYTDKLAFIETELSKLDSLKHEYYRFLSASKISATVYSNAFDPADIYKQSGALQDQKENILKWLGSDLDAVVVIDGFKSTLSPQSISLFKALFLGAIIGIIICFLVGLLIELDRKTKKYR